MMKAAEILDFWFVEAGPKQWFAKDATFDEMIRQRFGTVYRQVLQGEGVAWRSTILGRLAEIIVLDQFSRNLFREDGRAFAADGMALVLTQEALKLPETADLPAQQRAFLYMPLMHSESLVIHEEALRRFAEPGLADNLRFEQRHWAIIKEFGRYPHRNQLLGRVSTAAELAFLQQPGSSF